MADKLQELLDAQRAAVAEMESFRSETGSRVKEQGDKLIDVERTIAVTKASVDALMAALKERAAGSSPASRRSSSGRTASRSRSSCSTPSRRSAR